jgi:hypothetical protein
MKLTEEKLYMMLEEEKDKFKLLLVEKAELLKQLNVK